MERPAGMRAPILTPRLRAVASLVPAGGSLADVGSDHGWLPVRLLLDGRVRRAVATEPRAERLVAARRLALGLQIPSLDFRIGDGLAPLRPEDGIDVLVLSGMGGRKAIRILEPARLAGLGIRRVVVQPQTCVADVRRHLDRCGWAPVEERVAVEGKRFYEVSAFETGGLPGIWHHPWLDREDLLVAGPLLLRHPRPEVVAMWTARRERLLGAGKAGDDPDVARAGRILTALREFNLGRGG